MTLAVMETHRTENPPGRITTVLGFASGVKTGKAPPP